MNGRRRWPWVAQQEWHDILFMHWPVSYDDLKPYIPTPFELETYDGQAWISVILFQAKNSRFRGMPTVTSYPIFLQMNIRTYIKFDNEPGIYFLSVDVSHLLPVVATKGLLHLPYKRSKMEIEHDKEQISFVSKRTRLDHSISRLSANYQPLTTVVFNQRGTLPYWLTERYCFWMIRGTKIIKSPLSHLPWELYDAELDLNMTDDLPFTPVKCLQKNPLIHYAKSIHAYLHPLEQGGIYDRS